MSRRHEGMTGTNPSVGCIIVSDIGFGPVIVGTGVTALSGRPHAERIALDEAGDLAHSATAYVTLEPCSHRGKTTPCVDALIAAGIKRVVSGMVDPDHRVDGSGHKNLRAADVAVAISDYDEYIHRPLDPYLCARKEQRPYVTLKLAMTEEGVMGHRTKGNFKITCSEANRQTHLMRSRHDAILVGMGTVRADDPMLNCRLPGLSGRSPVRVVISSSPFPTETFRVFEAAAEIPTLWTGTPPDQALDNPDVLNVPVSGSKVDLGQCLDQLYARDLQSVMVEGGSGIATSFLEANLVDEIVIHLGRPTEMKAQDRELVMSPITPSNLPNGFVLCEERVFGTDRALRYKRS